MGATQSEDETSVSTRSNVRPVGIGVAVICLVLGSIAAPAQAAGQNTYEFVGIPEYLTTTLTYEVAVTDPIDPICSITSNGQTDSTAPYQFRLRYTDGHVQTITGSANLCDGSKEELAKVQTVVPFQMPTNVIGEGNRDLEVYNATGQNATLTLTNAAGSVLASVDAAPYDSGVFTNLPAVKTTTRWTLNAATTDQYVTMSQPVWAAANWTTFPGVEQPYAQCEVALWYYNPKNAKASTKKFVKDIKAALARISKYSNIKFKQTSNPGAAHLNFVWVPLSTGIAAYGWTNGKVEINTRDKWPRDKYKGFGKWGRSWLIMHEVMHTMGYNHVASRKQLMNPVYRGQRLGTGDIAGLSKLYPKANCS